MHRDGLNRRMLGGALAAVLLPSPRAFAQTSDPDAFRGDQAVDRVLRSTVPVQINGEGPFRFAIDTAASASVVAADVAERLDIAPAGQLDMHTVLGLERVRAVRARTLSSGALTVGGVRLAVGSRAGLIGLDGLLGLDLLADQRLILRFRGRHTSSINRSRPDPDQFLGVVRPRVRFQPPKGGGVELMTVTAHVRGRATRAIIDTGAQVSLINPALAVAAGARPLVLRSAETGRAVQSPTGREARAEPMLLQAVRFDDLTLDRLAVLMGDFHIFKLLGLEQTPAMLLGVDVLSAFERVAIDMKRGEMVMDV
ncbi:aspartyl protease family protein [Brevundimonas sp. NPDC092305]|uniref:aspartyl protease family protein n=1 Tax=Brevundimonas sp. NPDC092305 TaxID=3363957 RepID=UPI003827BA08